MNMDKENFSFSKEERPRSSLYRNRRKILYVLSVFVLGIAVGTLLFWLIHGSFSKSSASETCSRIPDAEKFNCHPDPFVTEDECLKRGCCYQRGSDQDVQDFDLVTSSFLGVPSCYFPTDYEGYSVNVSQSNDGIEAELKRVKPSGFPSDVLKVKLELTYIDDNCLRIKVTDPDSARFEPQVPLHHKIVKCEKPLYEVDFNTEGVLSIKRKSSGTNIFKTNLKQMIFSNQFLQLSTLTSSSFLYGFGEHKEGILKSFNYSRLTLFNQGDLPVPNRNLYGSHPFYLVLESDGSANGLFLLNSNAMDMFLQPAPAVSIRPIGGIFDFFVMLGPTPSDVVSQYTGIVGRPFMPPYWSLGFHLCRYGYFSLEKTKETLQRNLDAGVPIDVQWHDIDFMKRHLDFTYDDDNFAGLPKFISDLHSKNMKYIAMFSPGVSNTEEPGTYSPYDDGLEKDLFIKDYAGNYIKAKVWNDNFTVFPDFSNALTQSYWTKHFKEYHEMLNFDGAWIDMNEPLNFLNGSEFGCPDDPIEDPVYLPGKPYPLRTLTICMTAKHNSTIHYNEHNLLAFREATATYNALKEVRKKRPFIISRASFSGQGVHSGHWSGDITSDWNDLQYTIPSMFTFNMFGMPMIGSDICGFRLNATEELCARWQALGAFYPFSRNHNDYDTVEQDPATWGSVVLDVTLSTLKTRYYLLPYLYTLFHKSHAFGETVIRPLFFEFPNDVNVYNNNEEFLWGSALLIMPALSEGVSKIDAYIPNDVWYDFYTGKKFTSSGQSVTLDANLTTINLAVRGGYVIPMQQPGKTTAESRTKPFEVLAALNDKGEATGELYWDDGDSLDTYESEKYNQILFAVANNSFTSTIHKKGYDSAMNLEKVIIYGVEGPANVTINDQPASFEFVKPRLTVNTNGKTLWDEIKITWQPEPSKSL